MFRFRHFCTEGAHKATANGVADIATKGLAGLTLVGAGAVGKALFDYYANVSSALDALKDKIYTGDKETALALQSLAHKQEQMAQVQEQMAQVQEQMGQVQEQMGKQLAEVLASVQRLEASWAK